MDLESLYDKRTAEARNGRSTKKKKKNNNNNNSGTSAGKHVAASTVVGYLYLSLLI
jgi:hypothetical protein